MRLICPNCVTQYQVEDGIIPPEGRDVRCENCGHRWFQDSIQMLSIDGETSLDPLRSYYAQPPETAKNISEDIKKAEFFSTRKSDQDISNDMDTKMPYDDFQDNSKSEKSSGKIPQNTLDVLRSEAAYYTQQKHIEPETTQAQNTKHPNSEDTPNINIFKPTSQSADVNHAQSDHVDLGEINQRIQKLEELQETDTLPGNTSSDTTEMLDHTDESLDAEIAAGNTYQSNKDLLPEIDDISSDIAQEVYSSEGDPDTLPLVLSKPKTRDFFRGFKYAIFLCFLAGLIYIFTPIITEFIPQAERLLNILSQSFVDFSELIKSYAQEIWNYMLKITGSKTI